MSVISYRETPSCKWFVWAVFPFCGSRDSESELLLGRFAFNSTNKGQPLADEKGPLVPCQDTLPQFGHFWGLRL